MKTDWIYCPVCGNKTRDRIRDDTVLFNYPLYCQKCKQARLIMHYIRNVVVEQLVLENLREVVSCVKAYEDEFVQMVMNADIKQKSKELSQEEKQSVNVKSFLSTVKKYTEISELTSEIVHEFIDRIIVHEADKSSGKRIQEIEIIYNHIGVFDRSKVNVYMGKAV